MAESKKGPFGPKMGHISGRVGSEPLGRILTDRGSHTLLFRSADISLDSPTFLRNFEFFDFLGPKWQSRLGQNGPNGGWGQILAPRALIGPKTVPNHLFLVSRRFFWVSNTFEPLLNFFILDPL